MWCTRLNRDMVREKLSDEQLDASILQAAQKLGYACPTSNQSRAVRAFVRGKYIIASLLTRPGIASALFVFDDLLCRIEAEGSVVLAISPLTSLIMRDQVTKLHLQSCDFNDKKSH